MFKKNTNFNIIESSINGNFFSHANVIVGFNGLNLLFKLSRVKLQCNGYL
jgi:hypothetical protein